MELVQKHLCSLKLERILAQKNCENLLVWFIKTCPTLSEAKEQGD